MTTINFYHSMRETFPKDAEVYIYIWDNILLDIYPNIIDFENI